VKVAGRALEIVAVGLGQGGGNLAAEFARRGYRALAFNTAASDLATLSSPGYSLPKDQRVYIGLDGNDGAGADASYGRECVAAHAATIRERVAELAADADIVLLTCGLGGGTGSAVAELVTVLDELSLPLVVLATLPAAHESGVAKVTAVRAVNELVAESLLGWVFVDNARLTETYGSVSLDRYYAEINKVIVEQLDVLNRLNDRAGARAMRPLDGEDLRTVLLSGGLLSFGTKQLSSLDAETILAAVDECFESSNLMPKGYSLGSVSYLGLALDAPASLLASTPFSLFEQVSEQLKSKTGGAAIYLGTYRDVQAEHATLRLVASSQVLPEGMREMVGVAKVEGAQLRSKLDNTVSRLDLADVDRMNLFRSGAGASRRKRSSPQSSSSTASASAPHADEPTLLLQPSRTGIRSPERDAYEHLVREYLSGESEEVRSRVARRLDTDSRSNSLAARFYAVRAMVKIDPNAFADSLRTAANDEDASVRALANRALQLPEQSQQRS